MPLDKTMSSKSLPR